MNLLKADIIKQLRKDIFPLQGHQPVSLESAIDCGLGMMNKNFPGACFPLGSIHEFFCNKAEDVSSTSGFIAGVLSSILAGGGVVLWISQSCLTFPPALVLFGIEPEKVIFIDVKKEKELLWVMEEALKSQGLAAVVAETPEISFTASRRFQLAVEQSRTTGFVIRQNPRNQSTVCPLRWRITSLPSANTNGLPGVGIPRWNVELLKVRNGTPGIWQIEWNERFIQIQQFEVTSHELHRKAS